MYVQCHYIIIFILSFSLAGQSCGSFYGDCRGLPTYALISIISSSILVLMICIRCCIQINSNNIQSNPRRIPRSAQNRGYSPTTAPVHNIREDAPPSYAIATTSTTGITKY